MTMLLRFVSRQHCNPVLFLLSYSLYDSVKPKLAMQSPPNIPPETVEESEQVNLLLEMLGDSVNRAEALRVYRKHKGNMERAADAILSGDRGEDYNWEETPASAPPGYSQAIQQQIRPQPLKPSNTVIDLTGSDDELQRAMALSLETETQFGPSNRTPDVNWAMVPTNVCA